MKDYEMLRGRIQVLYDCVQNKKSDAAVFELLIKDAAEHNIFAS